jgi:hypothetical protein
VEAIRKAGMRIVYVPTIAGGVNEDQVGKILQFAIDNIDVSSGISYQPVAITGRISHEEREKLRYTITDLTRGIDEQTGIKVPVGMTGVRLEAEVHIVTAAATAPNTGRPLWDGSASRFPPGIGLAPGGCGFRQCWSVLRGQACLVSAAARARPGEIADLAPST